MNKFITIFSNFSSRNAINFHSIYKFRIILVFLLLFLQNFSELIRYIFLREIKLSHNNYSYINDAI